MNDFKNLNQDDVLDLIKDFPIVPVKNRIIITTNTEEFEEDEVNISGSAFSAEQYVLAVGSYAKDWLSPGQKVSLDLESMTIKMPNSEDAYESYKKIMIKPVQVGDRVFGIITDDKIEYLIND